MKEKQEEQEPHWDRRLSEHIDHLHERCGRERMEMHEEPRRDDRPDERHLEDAHEGLPSALPPRTGEEYPRGRLRYRGSHHVDRRVDKPPFAEREHADGDPVETGVHEDRRDRHRLALGPVALRQETYPQRYAEEHRFHAYDEGEHPQDEARIRLGLRERHKNERRREHVELGARKGLEVGLPVFSQEKPQEYDEENGENYIREDQDGIVPA